MNNFPSVQSKTTWFALLSVEPKYKISGSKAAIDFSSCWVGSPKWLILKMGAILKLDNKA